MTIEQACERLEDYTRKVKPQVYHPAKGLLKYPFLSAATHHYLDLIDWDAIWSGAFYLEDGDPEPLRNSLLNLIDHIAPDGKGQRRIGVNGYSGTPYQIRPFLLSGCEVLSRKIGVDWLEEEMMVRLNAYLEYWWIHRLGRNGLLRWLHVDEGFADNGLANWAWEPNCVETVDLNCQLAREHLAYASILDMKGEGNLALKHHKTASTLTERVEYACWNEELECYNSLYNPMERALPCRHIPVVHYTNLWPLWIRSASQDRADKIIKRFLLSEDELRSPIGIRSMSKSNRFFNNMANGYLNPMAGAPQKGAVCTTGCSNWQGPVWTVTTYVGAMALANFGYLNEAKSLVKDHLEFLAHSLEEEGAFYENYHSETGQGLAVKGNLSWAALMSKLPKHLEAPYWIQCS